MLSHSSSAYQPLPSSHKLQQQQQQQQEQLQQPQQLYDSTDFKINPEDESAPLTGESSGNVASGTSEDKFELTNIAVISSTTTPYRTTTTTTTSSVNNVPAPSSGVPRGSIARDFIVTNGEEKGNWTNFHFVMCVGIVGFFVFWIVLLCRMYLPAQFQTWIYGGARSDHLLLDEKGRENNISLLMSRNSSISSLPPPTPPSPLLLTDDEK